RHLFVGSENSIQRLQHDARAMQDALPYEERGVLGENIFLTTIEQPDDSYLSFESEENIKRWRATIQQHRPAVLWVDPWGDVQAGDPNDNGAARASVQQLMRLAREGNLDAGVVVITHSRTGAGNIAQAVGYNAANYMRGAKALFDCSRVVVNLAPGDESVHPPVVVACSKANDSIRFDPFALRLDPRTMLYGCDSEFDINAWRDEVEAAAKGKRTKGKVLTDEQVLALFAEPKQVTQFALLLRNRGFSKAGADDVRHRLVEGGTLVEAQTQTYPRKRWIGRPDQITALENRWAQEAQTKVV
ncbi:MAG: AAA family ATPase, partial [Kiritimatiellaeota bacterium]|nr:AAA family ATPase [Kiritimatiellota bacterium]